jgi:hypothetical protein
MSANQQEQLLSTVQVVLFSIALTQMYRLMIDVIKSRVIVGLIEVSPKLKELYARRFTVKPSGDVDVIQKQQLLQGMMQSWAVIQTTAAAPIFICDFLELMFPERASKYVQAIQQAEQQKQSQEAQVMQQGIQFAQQMGAGIMQLAKHPDYFSDVGKLHALPVVEQASAQIEQIMKQVGK